MVCGGGHGTAGCWPHRRARHLSITWPIERTIERAALLRADARDSRDPMPLDRLCPSQVIATESPPTNRSATSGMPKEVDPIKLKVHHTRQAKIDPATARAMENPKMMLASVARDAASPNCSRYCICSRNWDCHSCLVFGKGAVLRKFPRKNPPDLAHLSATVCWGSIRNRDCILYPSAGTFVLIRPAQTFYERINYGSSELDG